MPVTRATIRRRALAEAHAAWVNATPGYQDEADIVLEAALLDTGTITTDAVIDNITRGGLGAQPVIVVRFEDGQSVLIDSSGCTLWGKS